MHEQMLFIYILILYEHINILTNDIGIEHIVR